MNPLTRPPRTQPKLASSASGPAGAYHSSHERSAENKFPALAWVLPNGVAASPPPADGTATPDWLENLHQRGVSVLVSLDEHFGLPPHALARSHIHSVACPLPARATPPLDTTLTLCGGLVRLLRQGQRLVVCCDDTLERTGLVLGALLLWIGRPLHEAEQTAWRLGCDTHSALPNRFLVEFKAALAQSELAGTAFGRKRWIKAEAPTDGSAAS